MMLLVLTAMVMADSGRAYHVAVARAESLYVTEMGTGPAVVLIPGLFGAAFGFRRVLPLLAEQGYRAIVIEPLGIGNSSRPRRADYSQAAQADRLGNVLTQIGIDHAIVVGHSAGASIGFRLAYRRPDLVQSVISIDAGPVEGSATPGTRRFAAFAPWIKWLGGVRLIRRKIRQSLIESAGDTTWINDDVISGYTAGAAANLDATLISFMAMARAREPEKLKPRLPDIQAPVLLLVGGAKHAAGVREDGVALLRGSLRAFRADTVPGAGHYIQEENPVAVVAAVQAVDAWARQVQASCMASCGAVMHHPNP
ncbi:MAG: alpha/beta hydrolase [Gemmatimonadetes bacterium]|nr:alpha/beta hydrolase [Gemmatimonadota bacterium]